MRFATLVGLTALGADLALAQSSIYGQCGGIGFTGSTTCVAGSTCIYSNPYYSQCLPGTASSSSSSTTKKVSTSTSPPQTSSTSKSTSSVKASSTSSVKVSTVSAASTTVAGACTAAFTPITASAAVAGLSPGWNLGNTLDATPAEGSWNNPPVQQSTFANIRSQGYNSVRIPVTWADHFLTASPTWTVDPVLLQRVETVVDQALALGFYVVVNVHHDASSWADYTQAGANFSMIEEKFGRLWVQIGKQLGCKSSKLIFEPLNEPYGSTQAHADLLNTLNGIFLTSINAAGGYNPKRVVSLSGLGMNSDYTSEWFIRPSVFPNQPWALQFHYYSPYPFIFNAWGDTIWGSDADKAAMQLDFQNFKNNWTNVPTFIGEWDASALSVPTEQAARWKYLDFFVRLCTTFGYGNMIWDNGADQYNRATNTWYDPIDQTILSNAAAGKPNTLADSTTDESLTVQFSSAYLFHRVGTTVASQSIAYILNGNTLKSIKNMAGTTLATSSYSMSSTGSLTFTSTYLSTLFSSTSAAGVKDVLTLTFSNGSPLTLTIVQYDTPVFAQKTYKNTPTADQSIPITYKGLPLVAAVTALNADGTYLADTYTVYFGPMQHARWAYGNWGYDSGNFIITQSGASQIQSSGQTVMLSVEFFPRSLGQNSVNITITQ